jgi:hypothetical protein
MVCESLSKGMVVQGEDASPLVQKPEKLVFWLTLNPIFSQLSLYL